MCYCATLLIFSFVPVQDSAARLSRCDAHPTTGISALPESDLLAEQLPQAKRATNWLVLSAAVSSHAGQAKVVLTVKSKHHHVKHVGASESTVLF